MVANPVWHINGVQLNAERRYNTNRKIAKDEEKCLRPAAFLRRIRNVRNADSWPSGEKFSMECDLLPLGWLQAKGPAVCKINPLLWIDWYIFGIRCKQLRFSRMFASISHASSWKSLKLVTWLKFLRHFSIQSKLKYTVFRSFTQKVKDE